MSDDLDNRKQRMWDIEEVRGGNADIDTPDTQDTTDTTDTPDAGTADTVDAPDTSDSPDTTDISIDVPVDASIRELFLAAQDQGLTVDDLRNVNVYLFDRVHSEMKDLLAEVNYRAMKQRGDEVQMNKEFFNAIYRVASRHEDEVLAELELEQ